MILLVAVMGAIRFQMGTTVDSGEANAYVSRAETQCRGLFTHLC